MSALTNLVSGPQRSKRIKSRAQLAPSRFFCRGTVPDQRKTPAAARVSAFVPVERQCDAVVSRSSVTPRSEMS